MNHTQLNLGRFEEQLLIFGGPYGNLQATQAVLQASEKLGIPASHVICNGDCVAYCAQPEETVELIRSSGIKVLMGNCEQSLADGRENCGCGFETGTSCSLLAEDWYPYCAEQLSIDAKRWMGSLPKGLFFDLEGRRFQIMHGGLSAINRFIFASTPTEEKQKEMALSDADVVIGGHAGLPFGEQLGERYWLNSGVIGMPANDGTQDGWYLLIIPEEGNVRCEWHRLSYNARAAQSAMHKLNRFNGYAETLLSGVWPSMDILPDKEFSQQGRAISPESITIPIVNRLTEY
ncbi:MAG: metallophosphoesterase family protein [Candidatus Thiodiazotropha sp.]|nr:metallophosphoesterase family protein [Candidatus Thiodiazotropha sp.]MCM8921483.1 metallophosphoesterase family protein [Candidatus Thiodiazotropha sp.]